MCLAVNTFGHDILAIIGVYIAVQHAVFNQPNRFAFKSKSKVQKTLMLSVVLYRLLLVCCSALAASLHRRHLMVWAVFAPKVWFIFTLLCDVLLSSVLMNAGYFRDFFLAGWWLFASIINLR